MMSFIVRAAIKAWQTQDKLQPCITTGIKP